MSELRTRLLLCVLMFAAPTALAPNITAKPSSFTLNAGATHYPDHLWMVDEGSGGTLEDLIGSWDMTIDGADWGTDGVHGPKLSFVAANTDFATVTGLTLSGTVTWYYVVKYGADPAANLTIPCGPRLPCY